MTALKRWVRAVPRAEWHKLPGDGLDEMLVCGRQRPSEITTESQIIGEDETPLEGRVCYFCAADAVCPPRTEPAPTVEGGGLTVAQAYRIGYAVGQSDAFDAVLALHVRDEDTDSCPQCGRVWPCPTVRVAGREEGT